MGSKQTAIVQIIRSEIENGSMKPGQKLASIREQSQRFACSLNTIIHVYQELENQHLIYSRPRSGYFVVAREEISVSSHPARIDFASAAPDADRMPYEDFRHSMNKAIDLYKDRLFDYSDVQGLLSLRKEIVKLLQNLQIFTNEEQVFITSGAQQALHILNGMPFPNGKTNILIEQPTYWGMLNSLDVQKKSVIGIERGPNGLDWESLERHFQSNNIKFFYTVPRFHNPLGTSLSARDKKRLVQLAKTYDVYIVEDDYLADLEDNSKADPLYAFEGSSHVIYVRSLSKVMLPGLRVAAVIVPPSFIPLFRYHKHAVDLSTSVLSQGALEIYLKSGMYIHHIMKMRELYKERIQWLTEACRIHLPPDTLYAAPTGGIFASLQLPVWLDSGDFSKRLELRGIDVMPVDRQYHPSFPKRNLLRISIMRADKQEITQGIRIIAEELKITAKPRAFFRTNWINL
ncbi:aminotransferase-like domain-containing protein [Paenibacillus sedimenti]|uniref:PLP-dependent aminotransferase family protein n=1 Tax=Paenibacillus sedimenti TaxID=2770274 RepID=A0A926QIS8_9BACL|nr:PLP-dependent aminotransferase family protein [Paenibacillus sedimenti]MBD0380830.1 PLP-dependent aminotransferase family protein [Paenibacillus sedimenti]